jgi:lyso-ornithine lipid O-acyltransferase
MKKIRATLRLLYFAIYTSIRISQILIVSAVRGYRPEYSIRVRRSWAQHLLPFIGVKVTWEGTPPDFPCILMSNHRSYMDPLVLLMRVLAWPVSKAEVEKWPIVGYGAKVTGIVFLQRESTTSRRRTLDAIATKVKEGHPVMLFPEGTTTSQELTSEYKRGGFQLAAMHGLTIVPVAIEYGSKQDYWADQAFLTHFFDRFGEAKMHVRVAFGPALTPEDGQVMLEQARQWTDGQLTRWHAGAK